MKYFITLLLASIFLIACENSDTSKNTNSTDKSSHRITTPIQAVNFSLADLAGKPHELNEYLKKGPVMLVFFTTWCPYCKKEIPKLKHIYHQYNDKGLQLIAINAGLADTLENAKGYALQYRLPYVVLYDSDAKISAQYGLQSVPKIFYIQQDGNIILTSRKVKEKAIEVLLNAHE